MRIQYVIVNPVDKDDLNEEKPQLIFFCELNQVSIASVRRCRLLFNEAILRNGVKKISQATKPSQGFWSISDTLPFITRLGITVPSSISLHRF